jgi:hypothetical protein
MRAGWVIIGSHVAVPAAVMTRPWAVSGSALMTWMLTLDPAGTMTFGSTSPAIRKVSSAPTAAGGRPAARMHTPER